VLDLVAAFRQTQCVRVAAELELADVLAEGARSVSELAEVTGSYEPFLYRLMRALTALELVESLPDGRYGLTALGEELTAERLRGAARMYGSGPVWSAWEGLEHAVRTGGRAFDHVHGTDLWEYYAAHPGDAARFDASMAGLTGGSSEAIVAAYDFGRFRTVVDVGGGDGTLLAAILRATPDVRGVLVDVGHVVDRARRTLTAAGVLQRAELHDGDFRRSLPPGGDCYLLKWILHDWDDEQAVTILRCCRRAAPDAARLIVVERVIPEQVGPADAEAALADLNMMVLTGGRERTAAEFTALLADAGWRLDRVVSTGTGLSVIEAVAADGAASG
jgi:DNA-binding transcriptional ArsR family regulator